MPYTKRKAIKGGERSLGLYNTLNYIMNEDKTDHGLLISGYNCNPNFAQHEFEAIQRKYHKEEDKRVGYHIIQSFDPRDNIDEKVANEIGIKLCKELYPDFQCVVATHIDRGHIHNHIVINATSLSGRKLEDRLANPKEGLYGLREASDRIGLEYGCHVMRDFKPISTKHKKKDYTYIDQYYRKKSLELFEDTVGKTNWKCIISEVIEELKAEVNSFDELLEELALNGYEIKRGKYVSIRPSGKERFVRIHNITKDKSYSEDNLRKFFADKRKGNFKFRAYENKNTNPYVHEFKKIAEKSKQAIDKSSLGADEKGNYPKFYNSRYLEVKRYNQVIKSMELLNDENIYSYDDLVERIKETESLIAHKEKEYEQQKSLVRNFNEHKLAALSFIETYNDFLRYEEMCTKVGSENVMTDERIEAHLKAKEDLNNADIKEIREFLGSIDKEKIKANQQYAYLSYLKSKMTDLERLKGKSLELQGYIKGMSFSSKMIDDSRTTEKAYCVKIPYTDLYVYLNKECVAWDTYEKRARMYLVDDKKYELFDAENRLVDTVDGEQLEMISENRKAEVKEYYASLDDREER